MQVRPQHRVERTRARVARRSAAWKASLASSRRAVRHSTLASLACSWTAAAAMRRHRPRVAVTRQGLAERRDRLVVGERVGRVVAGQLEVVHGAVGVLGYRVVPAEDRGDLGSRSLAAASIARAARACRSRRSARSRAR